MMRRALAIVFVSWMGALASADQNIQLTNKSITGGGNLVLELDMTKVEQLIHINNMNITWTTTISSGTVEIFNANSNGISIGNRLALGSRSGNVWTFSSGALSTDLYDSLILEDPDLPGDDKGWYVIKWSGGSVTTQTQGVSVLNTDQANDPVLDMLCVLWEDDERFTGTLRILGGRLYDPLTCNMTYTHQGTSSSDFLVLPATRTIDAGDTSVTMNLLAVEDSTHEGRENILISAVPQNASHISGDNLSTYIAGVGDSDADGDFDSADLVSVFQAGKYETGNEANWQQGDWTHDDLFNSTDFLAAFQVGEYEGGNAALEEDWDDLNE